MVRKYEEITKRFVFLNRKLHQQVFREGAQKKDSVHGVFFSFEV